MARRRLVWHIFPPFLLITVGALLATTWQEYQSLRSFYQQQLVEDLRTLARWLEEDALGLILAGDPAAVDAWAKSRGAAWDTRITIIDAEGRVLGDSHRDPASLSSHADRPEVLDAQIGDSGHAVRFSDTDNEELIYVAVPLRDTGGALRGVLRTALPMNMVSSAIGELLQKNLIGLTLIVLLAVVAGFEVSRRITRPVAYLRAGARRFAQGHLNARLPLPDALELAELATSLNEMAEELDERMRLTTEQHNELQAVWASMQEGVVAFDRDGIIMHLNDAAARLFGLSDAFARGKLIYDAVPITALHDMIEQLLGDARTVEGDLVLPGTEPRHIHVRGSLLRDASGEAMGGLLVFSDVTQLRRLETARRDFVANVSHEIKTPITSIRGYAETLLDTENLDPELTRRFLGIIVRQSNRLTTLVEDILALAHIEEQKDRRTVQLNEAPIQQVVEAAVNLCAAEAAAKEIDLVIEAAPGLRARIDPPLLEQAVVNLVANAIKYSNNGTSTHVRTFERDGNKCIAVQDQGVGIEPEHLSRLFERFYRVDKARSRRAGGTGLGLAIVKHIVELHHGQVQVESMPGAGSVFTIALPRDLPGEGAEAPGSAPAPPGPGLQ